MSYLRTSTTGGKGKRLRSDTNAGATPPSPDSNVVSTIRALMDHQIEIMNEKFAGLQLNLEKQAKNFEQNFAELKESINFQGKETEDLKKTVNNLDLKLKEKEAKMQEEIDQLATYISRENLVIFGIPEKESMEEEDTEQILKEFYISHLKLQPDQVEGIEYQRVHRVPKSSTTPGPRPIKARYLRYKDKVTILRNAKNLKGSKIFIAEDLPKRVRVIRQAQMSVLLAARRAGKLAYFSRKEPTKLFVDKVWLPFAKQEAFMDSLPTLGT